MTKVSPIATIFIFVAVTSSTAVAQTASVTPAHTYDLGLLPPDVAARVAQLAEYGDRFDPAIRQIIAEASKPVLGWSNCDQSDLTSTPVLPES